VTFVAEEGSSILLHGTYPAVPSPCRQPVQPLLHARYAGIIEVGKDTDGSLFVIGELSIEDYLQGLGEMPLTWPLEALKAQAVAARTYAMNRLARPDETGARLGYQLCATDACQVYRGLGVGGGPYGDRWRKAVRSTAGKVLLYQGQPADAMYFSTSNGQTYGNDQVFGGSPLPYLRGVKERDDGASPLSHWTASLRFSDVGRFLSQAGAWPSGVSATSITQSGSNMVVSGHGITRTIDVVSFRSDLNSWAHCLDPDRYPSSDSGSRLPQTVPSKWFTASASGKTLRLTGRGWGHGVGMVQWGAYGKAKRGLSSSDILADYYGGLRPVSHPEPATIRVGIATGLRSVVVQPTGSVTVDGRQVDAASPWVVTGGKRLRVDHSKPAPAYIDHGSITGPDHGSTGQTRHARVTVPQTSVVQLVLHGNGLDLPVSDPETVGSGSHRMAWTVPAVPSGSYRLRSSVTNGVDIVHTKGVPVRVAGVAASPSPVLTPPPVASPLPSPVPPAVAATPAGAKKHDNGLVWFVLSGLAAVGVGVASVLWLARKSRRLASDWDPFSGRPRGGPPPV